MKLSLVLSIITLLSLFFFFVSFTYYDHCLIAFKSVVFIGHLELLRFHRHGMTTKLCHLNQLWKPNYILSYQTYFILNVEYIQGLWQDKKTKTGMQRCGNVNKRKKEYMKHGEKTLLSKYFIQSIGVTGDMYIDM